MAGWTSRSSGSSGSRATRRPVSTRRYSPVHVDLAFGKGDAEVREQNQHVRSVLGKPAPGRPLIRDANGDGSMR